MDVKILIVDDEPEQIRAFAQILEQEGYEMAIAIDELEALYLIDEFQPGLIILDIGFGINPRKGFDILKKIRAQDKKIIIIMLTDLPDEGLDWKSYNLDADHFVSKSISTKALLELVNRCIRRSKPENIIIDNCIEINRGNKSVKKRMNRIWEEVHLEPMEFNLLIKLVDNCGRVILREVLEDGFFPDTKNPSATLNRYISELRNKLEPDRSHPKYILTKKNVGYWFNCYT